MNKFLLLGALSTIIDFIIYTLLVYLDINYILSIGIAYSCGFLFNFYGGRIYVFKNGSKLKDTKQELLYVFIIALIGLFLNIFIVYILSDFILLNLIISRVIAIVVVFFWNFYARKLFVYN